MKRELLVEKTKNKKYNKPLLFIHGASVGAWMMQPFLTYFSQKGFDTYALSLSGHGQSDGYEQIDCFGLSDYVNDIHETIKDFLIPPVLIGHSMGGAVVQAYLNIYHDQIEHAVFISSATAGGIDKDSPLGMFFQDRLAFMRNLRKNKINMTFDKLLSKVLFSDRVDNETVLSIRNNLTKESKKMSQELLTPFINDYSKIKTKVLVFGSKVDQAIQIESTLITAKRFNVEPIWMADVCHFLTYDPNFENAAKTIYNILSQTIIKTP